MAKHTPSPWRIENQVEHRQIIGSNGQGVASTLIAGRTLQVADADARLIAAAPDLLDVAQRTKALLPSGFPQSLIDAIYDAIDKAMGKD